MVNKKIVQILPQLITKHFSDSLLRKHSICVIGYGSGIFPQTSSNTNNNNNNSSTSLSSNTIDLIMIVKNR